MTIADCKLYQTFLKLDEIYGASNPMRTGMCPKLMKIVMMLDGGMAGDYARNRRAFG